MTAFSVWALAGEKTKGGTGGLGKPPVPPQVEETGERLGHETESVPPERRRKIT